MQRQLRVQNTSTEPRPTDGLLGEGLRQGERAVRAAVEHGAPAAILVELRHRSRPLSFDVLPVVALPTWLRADSTHQQKALSGCQRRLGAVSCCTGDLRLCSGVDTLSQGGKVKLPQKAMARLQYSQRLHYWADDHCSLCCTACA